MAGYRDGFVEANGLRFHYLDWGDPGAPPVVLLHGTTSNAHSWDRISAMLAKKYRAIALDARNHGDSDTSPVPYNRDLLAEDVAATVDALGLDRFGLIGLSMGGRTAMIYAGYHPERIERLVIEDIAPDTPVAAGADVMARINATPQRLNSLDEWIAWARQGLLFADDEWLQEKARHALRQLPDGTYENKYRHNLSQSAPLTITLDLWEHIGKIPCSTLVIRGAESAVLNAELAERMVRSMPDARTVVVPRAGHPVHEDNPTDSLRIYAEFFDVPLD
ncbi:MAG: alpha/beta hydrolase [Dehalococcoidia bacterium]